MKTAIIFYSRTGHTASFAKAFASQTQADIIEIKEKRLRSNFSAFMLGAPRALMHKRSKLAAPLPDLAGYDRFILAFPIWAGCPAPPFNNACDALPKGAQVEVYLISSGGEAPKCREPIAEQIKAMGCELIGINDVKG